MRRLTRKIGLFGGPGAMMSAMGVKKPPPKEEPPPEEPEARPAEAEPADAPPARKTWLQRIFGGR